MSKVKHPKGLYVLFFTEMWERFGYYLMLGIFSLYMVDSIESGGMGFDKKTKSDIYGTYLGLVYLTPFIGGLIADRILGYRKSILIGGVLMAAGYFGLSFTGNPPVFYTSLLLIIFGNGFFKPNISVLVGNLYNTDELKEKKDAGYNIFYMGINVGAFACNIIAAVLYIIYGWWAAFLAAGIGMLLGLITFLAGTKHIKHADVIKPAPAGSMPIWQILSYVMLPAVGLGVAGYFFDGVDPSNEQGKGNIFGSDSNDAFLFGCIPVVIFYALLLFKAPKEEKRPIGALLAVFFAVIVFWAVFHQNGDALTTWAEENTDKEYPAAIAGPADAMKLVFHAKYDETTDMPQAKFDSLIGAMGEEQKKLKETDVIAAKEKSKEIDNIVKSRAYYKNLPKDRRPEKGKSLPLATANLYQSINPGWIILLTPLVVAFFAFLRRKGKEPSTPVKIALGLLITGLSALVMVAAVNATNMENEKASVWWLIMSYGVVTIGELCLSPMGLSLVSKLSPPRITALMMGGWFLSTSIGNKLAGIMSSWWEAYENKADFFWMNFYCCLGAFLLMAVMLRWLVKVMKEKGIN